MSNDIGKQIRAAREKRGWSQEFLAAKVGATQSTVDRIENGLTRTSRVLPDIARELDLDLPGYEKRLPYQATVGGFVKVSYVLPKELIERVEKYKTAIGVSSDDEVVRRIIDDFLKKTDEFVDIVGRILDKYKSLRSMREAAGVVLANHPLVLSISFQENNQVYFVFDDPFYDRITVELTHWGQVSVKKSDGSLFKFFKEYAPSWADKKQITEVASESDQIPF